MRNSRFMGGRYDQIYFMTIIFARILISNKFEKYVVLSKKSWKSLKIDKIIKISHIYKIITNQHSGKNNSQKIYLIVPTPHKSTIAHPMVAPDLDTDSAFIVLLVISRLEK